jgi:hypothetical protein
VSRRRQSFSENSSLDMMMKDHKNYECRQYIENVGPASARAAA